jgi:hypothetical protein
LRSCSCSWTSSWLFTGLLFFNFASCWTCCCGLQVLGLRFCHPSLTGKFLCHRFVAIPFFCLLFCTLQTRIFNGRSPCLEILLQNIFLCGCCDHNIFLVLYRTSMFYREPTFVAAMVTYKKENRMFSSYFLFLETMCFHMPTSTS